MARGRREAEEVQALIREKNRLRRRAIDLFVSGVARADFQVLVDGVNGMDSVGGWATAFRRLARLQGVPDEVRERFLEMWRTHGDKHPRRCR